MTYTPGDNPIRDRYGNEALALTNEDVDEVLTTMVNLGRYGSVTATQSSDFGAHDLFGAPNAVDGRSDRGSRTKVEQSPWWQIELDDLSAIFDLKLIVRDEFRDRPPRYRILLSEDGENWQLVYLHDGRGFGPEGLTIDLKGRKAKYLKITTSEVTELVFIEIEIWGYPPRF